MGMLQIDGADIVFCGIKAPIFTWVGAILILFGVLYHFLRFRFACQRYVAASTNLTIQIQQFSEKVARRPGEGLTGEMLDELGKIFSPFPSHLPSWQDFRATLTRLTHSDGRETYWASEGASAVFGEDSSSDADIDRSFYQSVPGIFTGIGLLVTFIAILLALMGVHKDPATQQFTGIDKLISGLSGKFISSIAALAAASAYMFAEKVVSHKYLLSRLRLVNAIDRAIPRMNSSQVLADMQRNMEKQTDSFRLFNADLSTRLQESFSTSMGPTLERMVTSIESLDHFLRKRAIKRFFSAFGRSAILTRTTTTRGEGEARWDDGVIRRSTGTGRHRFEGGGRAD